MAIGQEQRFQRRSALTEKDKKDEGSRIREIEKKFQVKEAALARDKFRRIWEVAGANVVNIETGEVIDFDESMGDVPHDQFARRVAVARAPWLTQGYLRETERSEELWRGGYLHTGDIATIDARGYVRITDRFKDVIKSGGEWISSIELENTAMGHPAVAEAAVIGVAHPKWTERPLLVVVKAEGEDISKEEMLAYYEGKVASWWVPTDVAFVDELPHTATGKVKKIELRKQFADYQLPD